MRESHEEDDEEGFNESEDLYDDDDKFSFNSLK